MPVHLIFDILAACSSLVVTYAVYRWRLAAAAERIEQQGLGYALALLAGAVAGGYIIGTANLWVSGIGGVGRSIVGALAGAIISVELFKRWRGVRGSTGLLFVPAFATSVMVGRIGCYLSGLDDQTHGTASSLPWAADFGDGVLRHPVQLYESLSMALFLAIALILLHRRDGFFLRNGFYLLTGWYAVQRFTWEFLKPYATVIGPLNIFHFVCLGLLVYAAIMIQGAQREPARP